MLFLISIKNKTKNVFWSENEKFFEKKKSNIGLGVTFWRKNFFCLIFDVEQEKHIFSSFGDIL